MVSLLEMFNSILITFLCDFPSQLDKTKQNRTKSRKEVEKKKPKKPQVRNIYKVASILVLERWLCS